MSNQKQTATIVDLISEGPIEGLVSQDSSIFLNGTPIIDSEERYEVGAVSGTITGSGTSIDFTPNQPFDLTDLRLDLGTRNIVCYGTLSATTAKIKDSSHKRVLLTTGYTWTSDDIGKTIILGASGENPSETFTIADFNNANNVVLNRPSNGPYNTNRSLFIEEIREITSVTDSDTIVIDSAFSSAASSDTAIILPVGSRRAQSGTGISTANFEDIQYAFREGDVDQEVLPSDFGSGRTAFATKFNEEIKQTTRTGTYSIDGANSVTKTATTDLGIGTPENIDQVKVNIQFPSLIAYSKAASEYQAGVEFQIYFQYKRGGIWYNSDGQVASIAAEFQEPIFGISDDEIQNRPPVNIDDGTLTDKVVSRYSMAIDKRFANTGMVTSSSKSEFVKEFVIETEAFKPFIDFRVRIKRVTSVNVAVRNDSQAQSQSYLQAIFAYSNDVLNFAGSAVAGIKLGSTEFDTIPNRSYLARGMQIQVPTNYFPAVEAGELTGKYTRNKTTGADTGTEQTWDGKFRGDIADTSWRSDAGNVNYTPVYCNNPAWVYYDIMINNRYGLGDYVTNQDINKYDLYRIARYCDELVPDGKGGQEPRFSCNLYIQSRTEAFKVVNDLASIFRSIVKWNNGLISAVQDAPRGPIYTFSNSNVLGGEFGYESTSKRLRINQVGVTWNNPEKFYKQDVVNVEDPEAIIEDGRIIKKDTVAVGCTSQGQATRLGKWMMLTERLETELVKFRTGINGAYLRPGDIIYVQDYNRTNSAASGRLARTNSHTTTTVYFDRSIPLEIDDYQLHLAFTSGAAYLQQDEATINGTEYARGDLVPQAYVGGVLTTIDSEEDASNALDAASGDHVLLHWSENVKVESRDFTSGSVQNVDSITVSSAFSEVPNPEVMFTLTNVTDSNTAKGANKYRVLNIVENDDKTLDISGHIYLEDKFAAIDRGYLVEEPEFSPLPTFDNVQVPPPSNVTIGISRVAEANEDRDTSTFDFSATISWGYPRVSGSDENYPYVDYFEIKHSFTPGREYEIIKGDKSTSIGFTTYVAEENTSVLVRTVNILGRRSPWAFGYLEVDTSIPGSFLAPLKISGITAGGSVGSSISVDPVTGDISFSDDNFTVIGPFGQTSYSLTSVPDVLQGSPEMSADSYTYVLFDQDIQEFKLVELEVDEVAEDPSTGLSPGLDFEYWKEFNGSTTFTSEGTITQDIDIVDTVNDRAIFINQFTVSLTSPDNFSPGDTIRIGSGADSWYGTISSKTNSSITTTQYINKAFTSGEQIYSFDFVPDLLNDFIIARMYRNNISPFLYELDTFATFKGPVGDQPETVTLTADDPVVRYDGDQLIIEESPGNNITLTATPGGSLGPSPEYRFLDITNSPEVVKQDWSASNTYVIPEVDLPSSGETRLYKVEGSDDGSPYSAGASDQLTILAISEGRDAETVNLTSSSYVTKYDGTGALITGSPGNNITLTATPSAGLGSPIQYRFVELPSTVKQDWSTDNTYVIPEPDLPAVDSSVTYSVEVTDGASPYSSEASDNVTITAISDGATGPDGRPGLPGSTVLLDYDDFQGVVSSAGQYQLSTDTTNDADAGAEGNAWGNATAEAGTSPSIKAIFLHEQDSNSVDRSAELEQIQIKDHITWYESDGRWIDYSVTNILAKSGSVYGFEVDYVEHDETDGTGNIGASPSLPILIRLSRALEPITGILTNESHAEAADQDGILLNDLTDAGGNFKVYRGVEEVTSLSPAPSFSVGSPATVDGLTISIDSAGVYSLDGSPSEWTGDQATFELTATYQGVSVTKIYSIIKVLEGEAAVTGYLSNEAHQEPADSAGQLTDDSPALSDAGGTFYVYDGITDVTTGGNVTYSVVGGGSPNSSVRTIDGLELTINTSTGVYTLSEDADWTSDRVTFNLQAVYTGHSPSVTLFKSYTISKSKQGTTGVEGINSATIYLYQRSAGLPSPSNPADGTQYTFATGVVSVGSPSNGWTTDIPEGLDPLYVIVATAASNSATDTIDGNEWSEPVLFSGAGINSASVFLYQRTAIDTPPASKPSGDTTYTFEDGSITFTTANGWTETIPDESGGAYLWIIQATAANTTTTDIIQDTEWSDIQLFSKEGADGASGTDAQAVKLESSIYAFAYNAVDGTLDTVGTPSLTATATNFEASPQVQYRFIDLSGPTEIQGWSTDNTVDDISAYIPVAEESVSIQVEAGSGGSPVEATDTITLIGLQAGAPTISLLYTNTNHTVSINNQGEYDWTGSGGLFEVFEGATPLSLGANGNNYTDHTGLTNGEYQLGINTVSGNNLTEPTVTSASDSPAVYATIGEFSGNLTQNTIYRITAYIKTSLGEEITRDIDISLTRSVEARPGLPAASTLMTYNNLETSLPNAAGEYAFRDTTSPATYTNTWSDLIDGTIDEIRIYKDDADSTDRSDLFDQVEVGDSFVYYINSGKWVQYEITASAVVSSDVYRWTVNTVQSDSTNGTDDPSESPSIDITWRLSRGADGQPGVSGASEVFDYDNLETSEPNLAGEYAFKFTGAYTSTWTDIIQATVIQLHPNPTTGDSEEPYFTNTVQVNDIITYYISDTQWADYRITSVDGLQSTANQFTVTPLEYRGSGDPNDADGQGINFRLSRPKVYEDAVPPTTSKFSYDNLQSGATAVNDLGQYAFGTNSTASNPGGTSTWSTITDGTTITYFHICDLDENDDDQGNLFYQLEEGDLIVWYDIPGKWVAFEISGAQVITTGANANYGRVRSFPVTLHSYQEYANIDDLSGADGTSIEIRTTKITLPTDVLVPPPDVNWGLGGWSVQLTANATTISPSNPGEILISSGMYILPDDTRKEITEQNKTTPFEGGNTPTSYSGKRYSDDNHFYLVYRQDVNNFLNVTYKRSIDTFWSVDNDGNFSSYSRDNTNDYFVAWGYRSGDDSSGIDNLQNVVPAISQTGQNNYGETGDLLQNIDLRNDELVISQLSALNHNPSMSIPQVHPASRTGIFGDYTDWAFGPSGYQHQTASPEKPTYEDITTRDVAVMDSGGRLSGTMIRVNPDTKYEISALVKSDPSSPPANMVVGADYITSSNPGQGKTYIGGTTNSYGAIVRDGFAQSGNQGLSTTYSIVSYTFDPSLVSATYFSPILTVSGTTYYVDWLVVRDESTLGATAGTDLVDSVGTTLGDNDVLNSVIDLDISGADLSLINAGTGVTLVPGSVSLDQVQNVDQTNASNISSGSLAEALGGTGLTSTGGGNDITNSRVQLNTDGSLTYDNNGSGNPTMNTLTDANNIRSRITSGLTTGGIVNQTVPVGVGGTTFTDIIDFSNGVNTNALASLTVNPTMQIQRDNSGTPTPFGYKHGNDVFVAGYEDNATRDVMKVTSNSNPITTAAIQANTGTTYVVKAYVKSIGGNYNISLAGNQYDSDLGDGKYYIGSTTTGEVQARTGSANTIATTAINTSNYVIVEGEYTPTSTAKWINFQLLNGVNNNDFLVKWWTVRDKSTLGATAGTDLVDSSGSTLGDDDVINRGSGTNLLPSRFSVFNYANVPSDITAEAGTLSIQSTGGYFGGGYLQFVPGGADRNLYFGTSPTDYNLPAAASGNYIVSGYVKVASGTGTFLLRIRDEDTTTQFGGGTVNVTTTWTRFEESVTVTGTGPRFLLRFNDCSANDTFYFDGLMVEERIGDQSVASAFNSRPNPLDTSILEGNITASRDQLVQFNKRYDNVIGPRRSGATSFSYKYSSGSGTTHRVPDVGESSPYTGSEVDTFIDNYVYFFSGGLDVARIRLLHVADYFDSGGTSQSDEIRSFYWDFEALNGSGLTASDFTVENVSVSPVDEMSEISNTLSITTSGYVGDASGYIITCTHNESGVSSNTQVEIQAIADTVGLK